MFNFHNKSNLFKDMNLKCPELLQDLEIIYENKLLLDQEYHFPKQFILHLNNLLRTLIYFTESYKKNKPDWLKKSIHNFIINNKEDFTIIKELRRSASHNKLIMPKESLSFGLFRIYFPKNSLPIYKFKLAFGDFNKSDNYKSEFKLKNTEDILLELNTLPNILFMDIEHSALNECLGVTRKWFFHVNTPKLNLNDTIDVYSLVSIFSINLINHILNDYSKEYSIDIGNSLFTYETTENNYINTILELDIYPALFSKWWGYKVKPCNYGMLNKSSYHSQHLIDDYLYLHFYENILSTPDEYLEELKRLYLLNLEELFEKNNITSFMSFIKIHHWNYQKSFNEPFTIEISSILDLVQNGNRLIDSYLNSYMKPELVNYYNNFKTAAYNIIKQLEDSKIAKN